MIEKVHDYLVYELDRSSKSDTVFVISAVLFNILVMFINWAQASSIAAGRGSIAIFGIFLVGVLFVSGAALIALVNSKRICIRCHEALEKIYENEGVSDYFPKNMAILGNKRFVLSFIVVAGTGLIATLVPVISMQGGG